MIGVWSLSYMSSPQIDRFFKWSKEFTEYFVVVEPIGIKMDPKREWYLNKE